MRRVGLAFAAYVAVFAAMAAYRWKIWSYGADTGTFTQIALNTFANFYDTSERGSHFHVHWSPILATLYPLAALTHSGLALQIAQIVLIGLGIFPCYALLRRYVADGLAAKLASLVVLYPPLLAVAFDEFHEIAFYPALVFALVWAIDAGRWVWAWTFGLALLLVREEVLIVVAAFGVVLGVAAVRSARRARSGRAAPAARGLLFLEPREPAPALALGVALAVLAPAVFTLYFDVVAPAEGGWTASHFYVYSFAHGPREVVLAFFARPLIVLRAIVTPGRGTYLLEAFGPLLFLGLRSPWMLVVLPGLAIVVLSSDASAWRMGSHYAGVWVPWLLLATAQQVVALAAERRTPVVAGRLATAMLAICAVVLAAFDPLHPAHYLRPPYADLADARLAFEATPPAASAFTHDEWFAAMTGRRPALQHVWTAPAYAILADDFPNSSRFLPFIRAQVARGCYREQRRFGQVRLYRRTARADDAACQFER